jgi:crotonobetainyl-CoA:carnitine CoA-transferase CaiB-like acyl-CoA transferase
MRLLAGLRVVATPDRLTDLGARMLAALGADVALSGDEPAMTDARRAAWHHGMRHADAPPDTLLPEADVFLDGRRRGDRPDLDDLAARFPRLVHVVATAGALDEPHRPATDLTLMALSGLMTVTGEPDRPPLRLPGEQAYALTGIQVATAALMGLHARRRTGRGQRIDVSAMQSAALANYRGPVMSEWTGRVPRRQGNLLVRGRSGVRQVWPCADGHVTWSMIDNPGMMRALVRVMEAEGAAGELAQVDWDAILVADTDQAVIDRWQETVAAFFARHTKARLGAWSLEHGWGLSPIATLAEVRDSPHLAARGLFVDVEDGQGGTLRLPGPLFRSAGLAAAKRSAAE